MDFLLEISVGGPPATEALAIVGGRSGYAVRRTEENILLLKRDSYGGGRCRSTSPQNPG